MVRVFLLMMVGGIGLVQTASDPRQVTLRWLRLGGINALALLAVGLVTNLMTDEQRAWVGLEVACGVPFAIQLMATQKGMRRVQRIAAVPGYTGCVAGACLLIGRIIPAAEELYPSGLTTLLAATSVAASSGLLGGFLMTMLLGHAYLTAGNEMTQAPFLRLVVLLLALWLVRMLLGGAGLWRLSQFDLAEEPFGHLWRMVMLTARWALGFIAPGVFLYMTLDCVRRRANQSATGILYVTTVLVILGEGIALALWGTTGQML